MPNQRIKIIGSDSTNGKLELSDRGLTRVNSNWFRRKVTWKIKHSGVHSFVIVAKKTAENPFEDPIPRTYGTKVKLKVEKGIDIDWKYSIHWKESPTQTDPHVHDPIIAINPTYPSINFFSLISTVAAVLLISLFFWKKKKKSNGLVRRSQ